jgi:hypothetical protein
MEFTREMLKDQLHLYKIQKKTFERSFELPKLQNNSVFGA